MAHQLRPRNIRRNYASLAGYEDEGGAGPSAPVPNLEDQAESGSDFVMDEAPVSQTDPDDIPENEGGDDSKADMEVAELLQDDDPIAFPTESTSSKRKGKVKAKEKKTIAESRSPLAATPGLSRPSNRQMYVLPTPSVHHRHRAVPLFTRRGRVERLESPPVLFSPAKATPTNNFTHNVNITDRVNKAWGYNVGAGPLWELLEDRSWFKEANWQGDVEKEEHRRPRVHKDISVKSGWGVLDAVDASRYLPSDTITNNEGCLKPPPPVTCSFGLIENQTRIEMDMFETHAMSEFLPGNKSHVFNAGAPVWGVDWCPIHPEDRPHRLYKQYLAVAPFPSQSHAPEIGSRVQRPSYACIQIWSLIPTKPIDLGDGGGLKNGAERDFGEMKCEMVICLDGGPAYEIKWCPLPSHDHIASQWSGTSPRKLGLLAGTFEDGTVSIYAIPEPTDVMPLSRDPSKPVFVRLPEPLVRIELEETTCWTLDWANSEMIAVGCTNGFIAIYDISQALKASTHATRPPQNLFPTHYLPIHQSAIRALAWIRAPSYSASGEPLTAEDPTVVASGGYDGMECLWDIREMNGNVMNRTRDVITSMAFSSFAGGPITIDHENIIKAYSASPSMLGRGHTLMEPAGPVWDIAASDYHPQLAVSSADGTCATTNTLRTTRRGGSVPFFVHKIYQLDYSRKSGEYRMLEQFLPQVRPSMHAGNKSVKDKGKKKDPVAPTGTGAWPSQVGVHRVAWNSGNGLNAAPLLASGTASGLCRVDWLMGRWLRGKVPYGGMVKVRGEVGSDEGELSPEEDEAEDD